MPAACFSKDASYPIYWQVSPNKVSVTMMISSKLVCFGFAVQSVQTFLTKRTLTFAGLVKQRLESCGKLGLALE